MNLGVRPVYRHNLHNSVTLHGNRFREGNDSFYRNNFVLSFLVSNNSFAHFFVPVVGWRLSVVGLSRIWHSVWSLVDGLSDHSVSCAICSHSHTAAQSHSYSYWVIKVQTSHELRRWEANKGSLTKKDICKIFPWRSCDSGGTELRCCQRAPNWRLRRSSKP